MSLNYEDAIIVAKSELMLARSAINAEISEYPKPISGCDAQFNHLIAERQKVLEALRVLDDAVFVPTPRTPTEFAGVESR